MHCTALYNENPHRISMHTPPQLFTNPDRIHMHHKEKQALHVQDIVHNHLTLKV